MIGFSPRKNAMTFYITAGFAHHATLLEKLGAHTTGQSCLYIKKLADVDTETLRQIVTESYRQMQERYR